MRKDPTSIDGFIPRGSLGDGRRKLSTVSEIKKQKSVTHRVLGGDIKSKTTVGTVDKNRSIDHNHSLYKTKFTRVTRSSKSDIEQSLKEIPDLEPVPKKEAAKKKNKKIKKPWTKKRKIITAVIGLVVLIIVGVLAYNFISASGKLGKVFGGSVFDLLQEAELKKDANGRTNVLAIGTSEDDPGHDGAWLTDSMMVLSISKEKEDAFMFSIPRDLFVNYGKACPAGYGGKINAYFSCVNGNFDNNDPNAEKNETERLDALRKFIGDRFGLDIQYAMHVNNSVIRDGVNAVGGIDVDIQGSNGAEGILDRNMDWRCNYQCYLVKYKNGVHHLDGDHALYLAMARGDSAPTYGLGNSNFDREVNQQKILVALKEKALSTGTLTDINKIQSLLTALGKNLRSNIEFKEIRSFASLASKIKQENIKSINFYLGDNKLMKTGMQNGVSYVMPSAGVENYSDIKKEIKKYVFLDDTSKEGAKVAVLNGSGISGLAEKEAEKLKEQGYDVIYFGGASSQEHKTSKIYFEENKYPKTVDKIKNLYNADEKQLNQVPGDVPKEANVVLLLGSDYKQ